MVTLRTVVVTLTNAPYNRDFHDFFWHILAFFMCFVVIIFTILGLAQRIDKNQSSANLKLTQEYI